MPTKNKTAAKKQPTKKAARSAVIKKKSTSKKQPTTGPAKITNSKKGEVGGPSRKNAEVEEAQVKAVWNMLFSEEVNGDQIESYMALDFDQQLESSRRRLESNSKLSVDAALAEEAGLPEKVSNEMIRRRARLAAGMCYGTAKALFERLGCGEWDPRRESDASLEISDAEKGPIIRKLLFLEQNREKGLGLLQKKKVDGLHAKVDKKASKVSRPSRPCSLIGALRFAANDPELEEIDLKRLFRDFCRSAPEVWPGEPEFLVKMGALVPLGDENQDDCGVSPKFWKPFFHEPMYIHKNETLTWLGTGLLPFKKKWSRNEVSAEDDSEPGRSECSVNGKAGANKREINKWRKRTEELIAFFEIKGGDKHEVSKLFVDSLKYGDPAKEKIRYFFGTLLNHQWRDRHSDLINRFHNPTHMGKSEIHAGILTCIDEKEKKRLKKADTKESNHLRKMVALMKNVPHEAIIQCHKMLWDAKLIKPVG